MKTPEALASLIEFALAGVREDERVHVYDAVAIFGQHVALSEIRELRKIGARAADVAASLRGADTAEMQFRDLLRPTTGGKGKK